MLLNVKWGMQLDTVEVVVASLVLTEMSSVCAMVRIGSNLIYEAIWCHILLVGFQYIFFILFSLFFFILLLCLLIYTDLFIVISGF